MFLIQNSSFPNSVLYTTPDSRHNAIGEELAYREDRERSGGKEFGSQQFVWNVLVNREGAFLWECAVWGQVASRQTKEHV
jgi:hypothetical protein